MSEPLTDKQLWVMRQGCDSEMGKALDEIERLRAAVASLVFLWPLERWATLAAIRRDHPCINEAAQNAAGGDDGI